MVENAPRETLDDSAAMAQAEVFKRSKPKKRFGARRIAVAAFSLVLTLGVIGMGLFVLVSRGPVDITFLSERLAVALEQNIGGGIDVDVGQTFLEKNDQGLQLRVQDVVLRDSVGKELIRAPDALVLFNPLQVLKLGLSPQKLALRGLTIKTEITPDGQILLSTAYAKARSDAAITQQSPSVRLQDLAAAFVQIGNPKSGGQLNALSIDDSVLLVEDRRNGQTITFDKMTLAFETTPNGAVVARGSLSKDGEKVPVELLSETAGDGHHLKFAVSNIGDPLIQSLLGTKKASLRIGGHLSAAADIFVDKAGEPLSMTASATLGRGNITLLGAEDNIYPIDQANLRIEWQSGDARLAIVTADFSGDNTSGALKGPLSFADATTPWRWQATGSGWKLKPLSATDKPVLIDRTDLLVNLSADLQTMRIENFSIAGPGVSLSLSGQAKMESDGLALQGQVATGRMLFRTGLRLWPNMISANSRNFFVANVREGDLARFKLALNMPGPVLKLALNAEPLPADAVVLDGNVENGALSVAEGLPPINGIWLSGRLDAANAQITATSGYLDVKNDRRIQFADITGAFNRLNSFTPDAALRFKSQSSVETMAEFLRLPTLKGVFALKLDPASVKGQFEGNLAIAFPLTKKLKSQQIDTTLSGKLTGVTFDNAIGRDKLENATLSIEMDKTGIDIKGEGRWQNTPVSLTLENDATDRSSATVISLTLDEAALKRRGIDLGNQLKGPVPVKIKTRQNEGEALKASVEIDLTRATIDGLLPGFQKSAGRAGKLTFDAVEKSTGYAIQNIVLESGITSLRGQADVLSDGTITSARLQNFRLSPGDNARLDFDRTGTGNKIVIRGNNFDARPFLKATSPASPAPGDSERELDLDIKTTLLSGYGGEVMTNAEVRVLRRGSQLKQLSLNGRLNGKAVMLASRAVIDNVLPVTVQSDDAGAFFRYLDLYTRMSGGTLAGEVNVVGRKLSGILLTRNFALRDEPALRRLVSEGAGDRQSSLAAESKFNRLRLDFSRDGSETTIKDAVIYGQQIGLTFNGLIDQQRDRVSLSGTFIPAFGLNNALSQIPVVGNLLTGGRNEGLLAITFGVSGRVSQPTITVNPLSAVAPGIFRKIFEFRNETTAAPEPVQPATPN